MWGERRAVIFLDTEDISLYGPDCSTDALRRKRTHTRPLLPVMEGSSMVSENNTRDVSSSKKSLQRRRWERLGLAQPPEDDRDAGTTLLQCGQEVLHLGGGGGGLTQGRLEKASRRPFRPEMHPTSSGRLGELP